jgi:hypothetical protein
MSRNIIFVLLYHRHKHLDLSCKCALKDVLANISEMNFCCSYEAHMCIIFTVTTIEELNFFYFLRESLGQIDVTKLRNVIIALQFRLSRHLCRILESRNTCVKTEVVVNHTSRSSLQFLIAKVLAAIRIQ